MSADTNYGLLQAVLDQSPQGWAVEFGVYSGTSLAMIAEKMPVIGFDSFEGLPEDWRDGFPKGAFDTKGRGPAVPENAMLVVGQFRDTLPWMTTRSLPYLGLVHIDCDLYSSTVSALEFVLPYIGAGTYIVFDEFHGYEGSDHHEAKAWAEFCAKYEVVAEVMGEGPEEKAFLIHEVRK